MVTLGTADSGQPVQIRVAHGRLHPAVAEEPADDRQPLAECERPRGEAVLPNASIVPVSSEARPASESRISWRSIAAPNGGTALAVRRSSFASSLASFSLRQQDLKRDFHEPASVRAATSAQRNSSHRAFAASAGVDSGGDQIPSPPSASVAPAEKSSSRAALRSTIPHVKPCYRSRRETSI